MADDELIPKFFQALTENGQHHVVEILVSEGLSTYMHFIQFVA